MTDIKIKQNISTFMDDEDTLDDSLELEACGCWERYHIISEVIKNNTPELITNTLAAKVSKSLEDESSILAPANIKSSPFKVRRLAVAASITGALALGSVVWLQNTNNNPASIAKLADVSNTQTNLAPTHVVIKNGKKIERLTDPRLNAYITQHDASILQSKSANIPQVRIVSFPE